MTWRRSMCRPSHPPMRSHGEAFDGLAGDRGDEVEVLVDVQHGET